MGILSKFVMLRLQGAADPYFSMYRGGGKGDSPPAPDYTPVAQASVEAAKVGKQLGEEQLAENARQYNSNMAVAKPIIQAQTDLMNQTKQQGDDYYSYLTSRSHPVEDAMQSEALGLTEDDRAQLAQIRQSETDAYNKALEAYKPQPMEQTIDYEVPTYTMGYESGAVKGSDLIAQQQASSDPESALYGSSQAYGGPFSIFNRQSPLQAESYYVPDGNGGYRIANQQLTQGSTKKQITVPGATQQQQPLKMDTSASDKFLADAAARSNARLEQEAADKAIADSRVGSTQQQNQLIRAGLRYGWSPDKIASMGASAALNNASAQAAAANGARTQARSLAWAKKMDVDGLYKGLAGASQGAYSIANQSGNSAVANQNQTSAQFLQGKAQGIGTIMQGQQMKMNGLSSVLNAQTGYANSFAAPADNTGAAIGALGGIASAAIIANCDRRLKRDIMPICDVGNGLTLYAFRYHDSDRVITGFMADEVEKVFPDAVGTDEDGYQFVDLAALRMAMGGVDVVTA